MRSPWLPGARNLSVSVVAGRSASSPARSQQGGVMPGMPRAWFGARPTRWRLVVPVVAAGAGLMFSMSFQAARGTDLRSDRGLPGVIQATNRNVADRSALVQSLQADVDRLTAAAAPYDARVSGLRAAADQLGIAAGTQAVHGPIVTVSLDDAQRSASSLPQGVTRRRHRRAPAGRPGGRQRPVARRRRGDDDPGPADDLDLRRPMRRQHPDSSGPGLLATLRRARDG